MKRRHFLKDIAGKAMGALALPYYIPSSVLGRDGAVTPSNRITIGCIGVGGQGTGNLKNFLSNPAAHVLAVCDVDRSHRDPEPAILSKKPMTVTSARPTTIIAS